MSNELLNSRTPRRFSKTYIAKRTKKNRIIGETYMIQFYEEDRDRVEELMKKGMNSISATKEVQKERASVILLDLWWDGKLDENLKDVLEFILENLKI